MNIPSTKRADAKAVAVDSPCSATAAREKIYRYLARSAGTGNWPTDYTLRCFIGMIQTGEATIEDMDAVGGEFLIKELHRMAEDNDWSLCCE